MSKVWTTIKVANIAFVIHLVLVVVGQTVKTASTGSLCEDPIRTPCVYVTAMHDETFWSVAWRLSVPAGELWLANPTVPLFWEIAPGTRIRIPVSGREPF
jgi:hypothetical protein